MAQGRALPTEAGSRHLLFPGAFRSSPGQQPQFFRAQHPETTEGAANRLTLSRGPVYDTLCATREMTVKSIRVTVVTPASYSSRLGSGLSPATERISAAGRSAPAR